MLIRFRVQNFLSFREQKEFNMLPYSRFTRLAEHKYSVNGLEVLKLAAIYGANAAGKSNLIKSIQILKDIVLSENLPLNLEQLKYRFAKKDNGDSIILSIEFFEGSKFFNYAIEINNFIILTEELYITDPLEKSESLIYERKTDKAGKTTLTFSPDFEETQDLKVLKSVLENNLIKPDKPILKLLAGLKEPFGDTVSALNWFTNTLYVLTPTSKPLALIHRFSIDTGFSKYVKDILCSLDVGIKDVFPVIKNAKEFFGGDETQAVAFVTKALEASPEKVVTFNLPDKSSFDAIQTKDGIQVKQLVFKHLGEGDTEAEFAITDESDGTIRLLEFIPAFLDIVNNKKVFLIDEMERSIHPLLVKELVKKFSDDNSTNGQLIFTTHESNLLDQNIFRQDEIWFAEKSKLGVTDLYSLSEFKEHNTIDIRKGYLNGRYGSIPFLGNLQDLNWDEYVDKK